MVKIFNALKKAISKIFSRYIELTSTFKINDKVVGYHTNVRGDHFYIPENISFLMKKDANER